MDARWIAEHESNDVSITNPKSEQYYVLYEQSSTWNLATIANEILIRLKQEKKGTILEAFPISWLVWITTYRSLYAVVVPNPTYLIVSHGRKRWAKMGSPHKAWGIGQPKRYGIVLGVIVTSANKDEYFKKITF